MSGSTRYLGALESLRELFADYPMRSDMSSIYIAADSGGQLSIIVLLGATDPVLAAAGLVEWRRTLAQGRTWVYRTADGAKLHVSTTGYAPECTAIPIAVLTGPIPHDCRLDHDLEPDASDELADDVLYHWLGSEVANTWPFPTNNGANP